MRNRIENGWKKRAARVLAVLSALSCLSAAAEETVYTLPVDLTPGTPLREECRVGDFGYRDPTISVEVIIGEEFDTKYWMADIHIGHASQLRTMPAYNFSYGGTTEGGRLSRRAQAVVAADGDFFGREINIKGCFVLRQGELYNQHLTGKSDVLLIDEDGDFHVIDRPTEGEVPLEIDGKKAVNALCFGPGLVENGEVCTIEPDDFMITEKKVARMGICQMGPLHYALVCCSGPAVGSLGMTLQEFAALLGKLGARWAYNLDGGDSTMMFTGGKMINRNLTTRKISDIVYFASAWPEGTPLP